MHSSTSNSSERLPALSYGREWFAIVALTAALLGGSELFLRMRGHQPSIGDSKVFWCQHRDRVYSQDGKRRIVIAGDSRAQAGLDPAVLRQMFPTFEVVHLAIDGTPGYEVARDLCFDPRFDGILLLAADATMLEPGDDQHATAREYLAYYHGEFQTAAALDKRANVAMGTALQSVSAVFSPSVSVRELLLHGPNVQPLYAPMQNDRFRPNLYRTGLSSQELSLIREKRVQRVLADSNIRLDQKKFRATVTGELRQMAEALRSRGGELVLIQMPTTAEHWMVDEAVAPKNKFWDSISAWVPIQTVHFKDYEELATFDCPDTSHLDASDAPEYTRRLALVLRKRLAALQVPQTTSQPT